MVEQIIFWEQNENDEFIAVTGTLADLISSIPYFINPRTKFIPPDFIIKYKLLRNIYDTGFECIKWKVEEIDFSPTTLKQTREILQQKGFREIITPAWVIDNLTWNAFTLEVFRGIPHTEYIPMAKKREELSQQLAELGELRNVQYFEIYDQLREVLDEEMALMDKYPIKTAYLFEGENP